jgi:hypothetical protein
MGAVVSFSGGTWFLSVQVETDTERRSKPRAAQKLSGDNQDENSATIRMRKAPGRMACRREGVARP